MQADTITIQVGSGVIGAVAAIVLREGVAWTLRNRPRNGNGNGNGNGHSNGRAGQQPTEFWENKFDRVSDRIDAMSTQLSGDIRSLRDELKPTVVGMAILMDRVTGKKGAGA